MRKAFLITVLALICGVTTFAQSNNGLADSKMTQKEIVKERRETAKWASKEISKKAIKDARKQAKELKKQGWQAAPGTLSIEKQLSDMFIRQHTYEGQFPKFIIGQSSAVSTDAAVARKQAVTRARVDVANNIKLEIAALTEETNSNMVLSTGEIETVTKSVETSQALIQQSLGRTEVVFDIVRTVNGKVEENVAVSYDGNLAKTTILELFEKDNAEIKDKLQKLLE